MRKKLTFPYRPWHTEKIEPYVMHQADQLARDGMFGGLLGANFKVFVKFDAQAKRIVYSFRAADDLSTDGVEDGWIELR